MNPSSTVLIVEDNATNLKLAADVLAHEGYGILCARDTETAQEVLGETRPDLILLDLQLPGMDGLSFARLLKNDARYARIPIVAMTAFAMKGDNERAREAGCIGYIAKPIDTRVFPGEVAEFLRLSGVSI